MRARAMNIDPATFDVELNVPSFMQNVHTLANTCICVWCDENFGKNKIKMEAHRAWGVQLSSSKKTIQYAHLQIGVLFQTHCRTLWEG